MPSLPVNPVLPPNFDSTPNEDRSSEELDAWWDRPYAVSRPVGEGGGYTVRCLDGGAWDRPTNYGEAATLEEAEEIAERELAARRLARSRPRLLVHKAAPAGSGWASVVSAAPRPDQPEVVLAGPMFLEQASDWIVQWQRAQLRAKGSAWPQMRIGSPGGGKNSGDRS